jgi:hypothetical protein
MSRQSSVAVAESPVDPAELRAYFRWSFKGEPFPCHMGKKEFVLRLKDLSRGGACGLVDEPFAVGDYFFIRLADNVVVEAEVRWVKRVMIGVKFSNLLTARFVVRLHEKAAEEEAKRKRDDLNALLKPR